jgi:hypothetical protein
MFKKIAPLLLLISFDSWADNINQLFGDGIFETTWGQSFEELTERFPSGQTIPVSKLDLVTAADIVKVLEVKDGRTVLGLERKNGYTINYNLDGSDKLKQIRVQFRAFDHTEILHILQSTLGKTNLENFRGPTAGYARWVNDEETISVTLFKQAKRALLFHTWLVITKESETEVVIDKEKFGF